VRVWLVLLALLAPAASATTLHAGFDAAGAGFLSYPDTPPAASRGACDQDTTRWTLAGVDALQAPVRLAGGFVAWQLRSSAPLDLRAEVAATLRVPGEMERVVAVGAASAVLSPGETNLLLPLAFNTTRTVQQGEHLVLDVAVAGVPCTLEALEATSGSRLDLDAHDPFLVQYLYPEIVGDQLQVDASLVSPWGRQAFGPEPARLVGEGLAFERGLETGGRRAYPHRDGAYVRFVLDLADVPDGDHPIYLHANDLLGHTTTVAASFHLDGAERYGVDEAGRVVPAVEPGLPAPAPLWLLVAALAFMARACGGRAGSSRAA
jgi:hypothetical protein